MAKKNLILFFLLIFQITKAEGQSQKRLFSKKINNNEDFFNKNLGKKTVVFFSFNKNMNVKKIINESHKSFVSLGVDVVSYVS